MNERRAAYDPAQPCPYCGSARRDHDRLAREWEACAAKAMWFAAHPTREHDLTV